MQIKNLNQLFFILIIGLFAFQTSTLFCPIFVQQAPGSNIYIDAETGNYFNDGDNRYHDSEGRIISEPEDSFRQLYRAESPSSSFLQPPSSPTRLQQSPSSPRITRLPTFSAQQSSLTPANLSSLSPQSAFNKPPSIHSQPVYSIPSSPTASETSFAAPEDLSFDSQDYPTIQPLSHQGSQFFPSSSSSSSSAPFTVGEDFDVSTFPAEPATGLTAAEQAEITKFLDSSLVLVAQLGSGKLNPTSDDKVAVRSSQSIFDPNKNALPFQFYEAGAPNLLGLSFGDAKEDTNPERAGIFGRAKSGTLEDSVMHRAFRDRCQALSKQFHGLCTQKFDQLKMARDADKNGSTADDGIAFWSASHKFLTLPSYLVYWAEILEITQEINRLCQREGVSSSSSSSSSDQETKITIARGTPDDAKTNTPTTTVSELATQIVEILFGRNSELSSDLTKLAKNTAGDGLDTILLVNEAYLNESRAGQSLIGMRWAVHPDFLFNDEKPKQVKKGNAQFLEADAQMRFYFQEIATQLQALLEYLTTNAQVDTNILTQHENVITSQLKGMISMFFSDENGFGHNLAEPILALAQVSESWRLVISTLIENNSHQEDKSKKALAEYVNFVGKKEKYGIKGPEYKISKELETFCEQRAAFFEDTRHSSSSSSSSSKPFAYVEQITVANGLPAETARTSLFALRDQDFRLPVDATHRGALCLNCGHSPFSLALVIEYLSNPTNRLYKVFFEDDQAFNGQDPKRESLDQISARLWGDAERLSGGLHKRDTLDFVHNPMSFRCSWCRHLERVWSKSGNVGILNENKWEILGRLDSLFAHIYANRSNQNTLRLPIAGFFVDFPAGCLTFPAAGDSPQPAFQTIGVNYQALSILFNSQSLEAAFPGISDKEILKLKVRIARTLQDLFGAWMAMTPEEGQEFARLTPSERWTGAGAAIAFPPNPTFQGGNRPGTLTLPPEEPQTLEAQGIPGETGGFTSPSPSSLTKTSPKRPPRKALTVPNRPSSSSLTRPTLLPSSSFTGPIRPGPGGHIATSMISSPSGTHTFDPSFVQPPALDEPGRLDSDEPIKDPDEFNAGPDGTPTGLDETPGTPTSTSKKRNKKALPSDRRSALTPSPYSRILTPLDEEGDNSDPDQPPKTEKDKTPTRSRRRRVQPEDKFAEILETAKALLKNIDQYEAVLLPQMSQNLSLKPLVQELAILGQNLDQAIRAAEATANDPSNPDPEKAISDLSPELEKARMELEDIKARHRRILQEEPEYVPEELPKLDLRFHKLKDEEKQIRSQFIDEEGQERADLFSKMEILSPIISAAHKLASSIQTEASRLTAEGNQANDNGQKRQALVHLDTAKELLKISESPLQPIIDTANSLIQDPNTPLPRELATQLKDNLSSAQQRYQAILAELQNNLAKARQLDQAEEEKARIKEAKLKFTQEDADRYRGNSRTGAFTGPERQTQPVRVASSNQLSSTEDFVSSDFPDGRGDELYLNPHRSPSPHGLNTQLINVGTKEPKIDQLNAGQGGADNFDDALLTADLYPKRPRTPTPPRSQKPVTSPRRTPLTLPETDLFADDSQDVPGAESIFPQFTREQSLVKEEGGLPPEQDQFFNSNYSFSTDGGEDDDHLASDEDPEMAQILENVAAAENPPPSPRPQPRRDAFTTSASPSDRPTLFPTARFIGLDQRKTSNPANQNVHELDQSSPAFPRGFNKRDGQGFGHLEDNDTLGTSISSSASWLQGSTQKSFPSAQATTKFKQPLAERSLQTIANAYMRLLNLPSGMIRDQGAYYAQIGPQIVVLYNEVLKHSGQGTYKLVQGGNEQQKNDLLDAIRFWVNDTANKAIYRDDQKIVLGSY